MGKVRVFLVDDHPVLREGIRRLLALDEQILVVGEADNGEDALNEVARTSPEVVLMDIGLPGMDGIEAARRLTAQHPQIKVVILSADGSPHLTSAIEAGACGYVLKTAPQHELVGAVLLAADGLCPLDPSLAGDLIGFAKMAKTAQTRGLFGRQQKILRMASNGLSSKEMAQKLFISEATIKREFKKIFDLLGVNNRVHAIAEGYRREFI